MNFENYKTIAEISWINDVFMMSGPALLAIKERLIFLSKLHECKVIEKPYTNKPSYDPFVINEFYLELKDEPEFMEEFRK